LGNGVRETREVLPRGWWMGEIFSVGCARFGV
jgi:hypothetical protein